MTLPTTITLGPATWRIEYSPTATEDGELGRTYPDQLLVQIATGLPPDMERMVLWHELLHACCSMAQVRGKLDEEAWVSRVTPWIVELCDKMGVWNKN